MTDTWGFKSSACFVISLAVSIWVFSTSPAKPGKTRFSAVHIPQFQEMWVQGKSFCSGKEMLRVLFYTLSMEKIAQCYILKKLFCRSSARKNYVFVVENNFELWGFLFL